MTRFIGVLMLLAALPSASVAETARAQFVVSAQVVPRVSLDALVEPSSFTVTQADVERGYVDVRASYRVRNNDPAGYLLRFVPRTALADGIVVTGLGSMVTVAGHSVEVVRPASMTPSRLDLGLRVMLDAGLAPGEYPLPLEVSAATY
jgi:hypothetical protein